MKGFHHKGLAKRASPSTPDKLPSLISCCVPGWGSLLSLSQALHCSSTKPCLFSSCPPLSPEAAAENTTLNSPSDTHLSAHMEYIPLSSPLSLSHLSLVQASSGSSRAHRARHGAWQCHTPRDTPGTCLWTPDNNTLSLPQPSSHDHRRDRGGSPSPAFRNNLTMNGIPSALSLP